MFNLFWLDLVTKVGDRSWRNTECLLLRLPTVPVSRQVDTHCRPKARGDENCCSWRYANASHQDGIYPCFLGGKPYD